MAYCKLHAKVRPILQISSF